MTFVNISTFPPSWAQGSKWQLRALSNMLRPMYPGLVLLGTAVKARRWPRRGLHPFQAWQRTLSHESVSVHSLAVYIHKQINGTFIFQQLSERVDLLEYPSSGDPVPRSH